jgi:hypothetical protein
MAYQNDDSMTKVRRGVHRAVIQTGYSVPTMVENAFTGAIITVLPGKGGEA